MLSKLNENYHLRKCYLKTGEVPTQSVMKNKMGKPLAEVYFQTMHPTIKILAGVAPLLTGPGSRLWISPKSYLDENVKLKPVNENSCVEYMNQAGVEVLARCVKSDEDDILLNILKNAIKSSDQNWKIFINEILADREKRIIESEKNAYVDSLKLIVKKNETLYTLFILHLEEHLKTVANAIIQEEKDTSKKLMEERLKKLILQQHNTLILEYRNMLNDKKDYYYNKFQISLSSESNKFLYNLMSLREEKYKLLNSIKALDLKNKNLFHNEKSSRTYNSNNDENLSNVRDSVTFSSCATNARYLLEKFSQFSFLCKQTWPRHNMFFENMEKLLQEHISISECWDKPNNIGLSNRVGENQVKCLRMSF